jgi:norsolorinic acid ketoreductase
MSGQTYLITGANRGIGKVILATYLLRPNNTVIAAVRDVASSQKDLASVPVGKDSKLIIIKIDSTSETDPAAAAAELSSKYGIQKIDVLISNAGIMPTAAIVPALKTETKHVRDIFEVNTVGPLLLIQAFIGLLSASSNPRFFVITSAIGSIALLGEYNVPFFAYGLR